MKGTTFIVREHLDRHAGEYIAELRRNGGIINAEIISSEARNILKNFDVNLLESTDGHIFCSLEWEKGLLKRVGYVKRRANTKLKVPVNKFEVLKAHFNFDVQFIA